MKVCLYLELEGKLSITGIGTAIRNQRKALKLNNIEYTNNLDDEFDILHLNIVGLKSLSLARRMKKKGKKVVIHAHTTADDFRDSFRFSNLIAPYFQRYLTFYYNQADLVLCPSEYTKNVLERYGVKRPIRVISNGVDTNKFKFSKEKRVKFRKEYDLKDTDMVPLCVGHLFIRKGIKTFMNLARRYNEKFIWVGRRYKKLEEREISNLIRNKPDNVILVNYIEDIVSAYCGADIFLFPSNCENQGIVLLEAAACKMPILCRDLLAYKGWLIDEVNCLKAKNFYEFEEKLERLMMDKELRNKLAKNAHTMAKEHSLKNVGAKLKMIYDEVMEK